MMNLRPLKLGSVVVATGTEKQRRAGDEQQAISYLITCDYMLTAPEPEM
jgi:hypothetical protein